MPKQPSYLGNPGYVKFVFDWQHAVFNHPISLTEAPGGNLTKNEDIFWFRFQLYY